MAAPRKPSRRTGSSVTESAGFEASLKELEATVTALESGGLDLDGALAAYERGVGLLARCQGLLQAAEHRVALLTGVAPDGTPEAVPFDPQNPPPAGATEAVILSARGITTEPGESDGDDLDADDDELADVPF